MAAITPQAHMIMLKGGEELKVYQKLFMHSHPTCSLHVPALEPSIVSLESPFLLQRWDPT